MERKSLLLSGHDARRVRVPATAVVVSPPTPRPPLSNFGEAVERALEAPLDGVPLVERMRKARRVLLVVDDTARLFASVEEARRQMVAAVLQGARRVSPAPSLALLSATGLAPKSRLKAVRRRLGLATGIRLLCHDSEDPEGLQRAKDAGEVPLEVNRELTESDLVVNLHVACEPKGASVASMVEAVAGYRTTRELYAPGLFSPGASPWEAASPFEAVRWRVLEALEKKVPLFQVTAVFGARVWASALLAVGPWRELPAFWRRRLGGHARGGQQPVAVFSGSPGAVEVRARKAFLEQWAVEVPKEADVLAFGVPDALQSADELPRNPLGVAEAALGRVSAYAGGRPLLRKGGALVFAHPMRPRFGWRALRPHEEFFERVLRFEREPEAIWRRHEAYFAGRPELVAAYREGRAAHGASPVCSWNLCSPLLRWAGRVVAAEADLRSVARMGFFGAKTFEKALEEAESSVGGREPRTTVLELPPAFWAVG